MMYSILLSIVSAIFLAIFIILEPTSAFIGVAMITLFLGLFGMCLTVKGNPQA